MQDKFVGDIGDYVKYGLLRALTCDMKLGVAWYLYPDESSKTNGDHTEYLQQRYVWRSLDSVLFDRLSEIVQRKQRAVAEIQQGRLLGDARFASERLRASRNDNTWRRRSDWRKRWFERVRAELDECDVVFADPDNGLFEEEKFRYGTTAHWKCIPLCEAARLAEGRTAVIYHHNTRRRGGHEEEINYWMGRLGEGTMAIRWSAYSTRTFFVVNPTPDIRTRLRAFNVRWRELRRWGASKTPKAPVTLYPRPALSASTVDDLPCGTLFPAHRDRNSSMPRRE